jgi:hypothetical protein
MKLANDYKKILKTLGFNLAKQQPKHIKRQEGNPLQISSITEERKHKILENTGVIISPRNKEHRQKYFAGLKPYKFLLSLIDENLTSDKNILFEGIAKSFVAEFTKSIDLICNIYQAEQIPEIYGIVPNQLNDNGKRSYITTGVSCMQGKVKRFFDVYKDTQDLQLITLEDKDGNLYGRALLWSDRHNHNPVSTITYKDDTNEVEKIDTKIEKKFYLDRIYIADALCGTDKIKAVYQAKVFNFVCEVLGVDSVPCYSSKHLANIKSVNVDKGSRVPTDFYPLIRGEALDYDFYPYCDTFQGLDGATWYEDGDECEVKLTETDGQNANATGCNCEDCGDRVHEDEIYFAEQDEQYLCENCCTFSEYEDQYINNNYIREHRSTGDIMHEDNL